MMTSSVCWVLLFNNTNIVFIERVFVRFLENFPTRENKIMGANKTLNTYHIIRDENKNAYSKTTKSNTKTIKLIIHSYDFAVVIDIDIAINIRDKLKTFLCSSRSLIW